MAVHPTVAALTAIHSRLNNQTDAGNRVRSVKVPDTLAKPYLVINKATGTQRNFHTRKGDPSYLFDVKAVANDVETALTIAQQAAELLDDQGEQDLGGLSGGTDWHILKAMVEGEITQKYPVGTSTVYEEGFQLRVNMEAK